MTKRNVRNHPPPNLLPSREEELTIAPVEEGGERGNIREIY